jgi:oxaloacetate decarboxylase alpha subunit
MARIEFIDQTLRDGQQSLWGMRMRAGHALPVASQVDRTGYAVTDLTGSSMFEVLIKYCREDPWAGLDAMARAMPRTPLRAGMRSNACVTFSVTPNDLMDLWVRRLAAHGIRSFWIYDVLYNMDKMLRLAKVAHECGATVAGAINYSLSPVHTDQYYADRAGDLAASEHVDSLLLYDTAGSLTPERARTLVPQIVARAMGKPVEVHSHNVTGLSTWAYIEAVKGGATIVHTAARPLANGPSLPSTQIMLRNLALLGYETGLRSDLLEEVSAHFEKVAATYGLPTGVPNEFDLFAYEHQVPGGMTGTLKNQLAQHRMPERLDEVLREMAVVRRELGYPGMMTPFSQLVGTQAVLNIVTGTRYSVIPDEVIQYACGWYGQPVAPIEAAVMDRLSQHARYRDFDGKRPEQPSLAEIRRPFGDISDDELLLRFLVPEGDIVAMRAAGPLRTVLPVLASAEADLARDLLRQPSLRHLEVIGAHGSLTLTR